MWNKSLFFDSFNNFSLTINNRRYYQLPYGNPDPAEPRKLPKSQSETSAKHEDSNYEDCLTLIFFWGGAALGLQYAPISLHFKAAVIFLSQTIRSASSQAVRVSKINFFKILYSTFGTVGYFPLPCGSFAHERECVPRVVARDVSRVVLQSHPGSGRDVQLSTPQR